MKKRVQIDICDKLFETVEKPERLEFCKAVNVYDNKYRINLYSKVYDPIKDIDKLRITHSYFAVLNGNNLNIRA